MTTPPRRFRRGGAQRDPLSIPVVPGLSADARRGLSFDAIRAREQAAADRAEQISRNAEAARLAERVTRLPAPPPPAPPAPETAPQRPVERPGTTETTAAAPNSQRPTSRQRQGITVNLRPTPSPDPGELQLTAPELDALARFVDRQRRQLPPPGSSPQAPARTGSTRASRRRL